MCRYICKSLVQAIPERAKEVDEARHRCGHQLRSNLWLFLENPSMNIYSKFFNILSVMFILVSTVSFCIETLPMFDDSYVNKEWVSFKKLIFFKNSNCKFICNPKSIGRHRLHRCWWRMLETKFVGDKFEMLVIDLIHWENHQHNEKSRQHNDSATNISNQSPS